MNALRPAPGVLMYHLNEIIDKTNPVLDFIWITIKCERKYIQGHCGQLLKNKKQNIDSGRTKYSLSNDLKHCAKYI